MDFSHSFVVIDVQCASTCVYMLYMLTLKIHARTYTHTHLCNVVVFLSGLPHAVDNDAFNRVSHSITRMRL
jgi:hypothetical protein